MGNIAELFSKPIDNEKINIEGVNEYLRSLQNQKESSIKERRNVISILNKIDRYTDADIDLRYDKSKGYLFTKNDKVISDFFNFKQLKIIDKILEAYYNNKFDPIKNKFKIVEEKVYTEMEGHTTDEARKLISRSRKMKNGYITRRQIDVTNSQNRDIISILRKDNLTVLTELGDSDLKKYINILNIFIKEQN